MSKMVELLARRLHDAQEFVVQVPRPGRAQSHKSDLLHLVQLGSGEYFPPAHPYECQSDLLQSQKQEKCPLLTGKISTIRVDETAELIGLKS